MSRTEDTARARTKRTHWLVGIVIVTGALVICLSWRPILRFLLEDIARGLGQD